MLTHIRSITHKEQFAGFNATPFITLTQDG
jgi:hypothetical protein